MVVIDETVVNVALPSIRADLGMDSSRLAWFVSAYMLFFGGFLLLAGRLADLVGRRRLFLVGLTLFALASLAAGCAEGQEMLIVARSVQGLGGAALAPAALSILTTTFDDPASRRRALAAWTATLGLGATLGVLLGGVIVEYLAWNWIFWVNVPVGAVLLVGCLLAVPDHRPTPTGPRPGERVGGSGPGECVGGSGPRGRAGGRVDAPGAVMVTAAGLLLVYTVIRTDTRGWSSPATLLGLAGVAALTVACLWWERVAARPLIPAAIVRRRAAVAYPMAVLTAGALFGMFFFLTLYMQFILGWSPLRAGLAWAPHGATVALVSGIAMKLVPRFGVRVLALSGLCCVALAQALLIRIPVAGSYLDILPSLLLNGVGLGLGMVPIAVVAVSKVPHEHHGIASGMVNASQQLGGAVGLSVLVSVVAGKIGDKLAAAGGEASALSGAVTQGTGNGRPGTNGAALAVADATVDAFHTGFALAIGFVLLAAALSFLLPRMRGPVDMADLV